MSTTTRPAPPFDPDLAAVLEVVNASTPPTLTRDDLPALRAGRFTPSLHELLADRPIAHEERTIPGPDDAPDLLISIFRPTSQVPGGPIFLFAHVGGMVFGDRFVGIAPVIDYVEALNAVVVTVDYRLAPEHPAPAALEDCFAALRWTAEHAEELGADPSRLVVIGTSAGGGLAAGLALMARDRGAPTLAGQVLTSAMLDEHNASTSSRQVDGIGIWDRTSNEMGWNAALGARRGSATAHESPGQAHDLGSLPPAYIEAGSVEVFRDEDVAYASGIWAAGGVAELHVWPGAFHLFELLAPEATISIAAREERLAWLRRLLEDRS